MISACEWMAELTGLPGCWPMSAHGEAQGRSGKAEKSYNSHGQDPESICLDFRSVMADSGAIILSSVLSGARKERLRRRQDHQRCGAPPVCVETRWSQPVRGGDGAGHACSCSCGGPRGDGGGGGSR